MFGYGLKSLLSKEKNIKIVGQESDTQRAHQKIKKLQPDTVIVDTSRKVDREYTNFIEILEKGASPIKVILISLDDNKIRVVQTKQWIADGVADLVNAIAGAFASDSMSDVSDSSAP